MTQQSGATDAASPLTTSRRAVLAGAGATVLVVLTGCQTYDGNSRAPSQSTADKSKPLAQTSQVPVGGGVVTDRGVVLTQPTAGQYRGFSAVCTHQGCTVAAVANGVIVCPCHGSQFKIQDGSVSSGPATRPLPAIALTVTGNDIFQA